jgi:hypothetical protein
MKKKTDEMLAADGGPIVRPKRPAPDKGLLKPVDLVDIVGAPWRVESVNDCAATVVCQGGPRKGARLTVAPTSSVRQLTEEEGAAMVESARTQAVASEDRACECGHEWSRHYEGGPCVEEVEGGPAGCCPCSQYKAHGRSGAGWHPTQEEADRVVALHEAGMAYLAIEKEMGWPDGHGTRPWRIVKGQVKVVG